MASEKPKAARASGFMSDEWPLAEDLPCLWHRMSQDTKTGASAASSTKAWFWTFAKLGQVLSASHRPREKSEPARAEVTTKIQQSAKAVVGLGPTLLPLQLSHAERLRRSQLAQRQHLCKSSRGGARDKRSA